jgi:hypothetical protein
LSVTESRTRRRFADPALRAAIREATQQAAAKRLGRPLTVGERHIDLLGYDRDLEAAKEALRAAIEAEKKRAIGESLRSGRNARLEITDRMRRALQRLYEAGQRHAREEIRSRGLTPRTDLATPTDPRLANVEAALQRHLNGMSSRVDADSISLLAGGEPASAVARAMERQVPGALDAASRLVSSTMALGLDDVFSKNAGLFTTWQYSAVMDAATCEVCESLDGTEYGSIGEAYNDLPNFGPNPDCFGNGRCRCRLVPGDTDAAAAAAAEAPIAAEPAIPEGYTRLGWEIEQLRNDPALTRSTTEIVRGQNTGDAYYQKPKLGDGIDFYGVAPYERDRYLLVDQAGEKLDQEIQQAAAAARSQADERLSALRVEREDLNEQRRGSEEYADRLATTRVEIEDYILSFRNSYFGRPFRELSRDERRAVAVALDEDPRLFALRRTEREQIDALLEFRAPLDNRLIEIVKERADLEKEVADAERKAVLDVLNDVRPGGMGGSNWTFTTRGRTSRGRSSPTRPPPTSPATGSTRPNRSRSRRAPAPAAGTSRRRTTGPAIPSRRSRRTGRLRRRSMSSRTPRSCATSGS